jgi:hypothetical protein
MVLSSAVLQVKAKAILDSFGSVFNRQFSQLLFSGFTGSLAAVIL